LFLPSEAENKFLLFLFIIDDGLLGGLFILVVKSHSIV